jgi:hypothetical protein
MYVHMMWLISHCLFSLGYWNLQVCNMVWYGHVGLSYTVQGARSWGVEEIFAKPLSTWSWLYFWIKESSRRMLDVNYSLHLQIFIVFDLYQL